MQEGLQTYLSAHSQIAADLLASLLVTLALSVVMTLAYRFCHDTLTYNRKFNVTLVMLALASAILLSLIQNNPLFSLGALGALSICRIRTNTRDPRDLGFVFWSLSIGMSAALGEYLAGLAGTLVVGCVMLCIGRTRQKRDAITMVVRGEKEHVGAVQEVLRQTPGSTAQAKNLFADAFELVYELKISAQEEEKLLLLLNNMEGVHGVNVLAPMTEVA